MISTSTPFRQTGPDLTDQVDRQHAIATLIRITQELDVAVDALMVDEGTPDMALFRGALARASVLTTSLVHWTGAAG